MVERVWARADEAVSSKSVAVLFLVLGCGVALTLAIMVSSSPGRAQSPIMLGGICARADVVPDQACGCLVDRLLVSGVRSRTVRALVEGQRADIPVNALDLFDDFSAKCIENPRYADQQAGNQSLPPPGEPLRAGLSKKVGSAYHMCTRTLSIVGQQCGCMVNRASDAGISNNRQVRMFAGGADNATPQQVATFEGIVRSCSGYNLRVSRGSGNTAVPANSQAAASTRAGIEPFGYRSNKRPRLQSPGPGGISRTPHRDFTIENDQSEYALASLAELTTQEWAAMQGALRDCGTSLCDKALQVLRPTDFVMVNLIMGEAASEGYALLTPLDVGNACTREGCIWLIMEKVGGQWKSRMEGVGYSSYLGLRGEYSGVAELHLSRRSNGPAYHSVVFGGGVDKYQLYASRSERDAQIESMNNALGRIRSGQAQSAAPVTPAVSASGPRPQPPVIQAPASARQALTRFTDPFWGPNIPDGLHPKFRYRASDEFSPLGFFAPDKLSIKPFLDQLNGCPPENPGCRPGDSQPSDFVVAPVDLNQDARPEILVLPRRGGSGCASRGCFWGVLYVPPADMVSATNTWPLAKGFGFSASLTVTSQFNGHAVLFEQPDFNGPAWFYMTEGGGQFYERVEE
ncbi:MAG: hypothetical protein AAF494_04090 [Pseudomonadota bacterium]